MLTDGDDQNQCDQIWRNFATVAKFTSFGNFWQTVDSLFLIWQNADHTLANLDIIGLIFIAANGPILKNNLTIWSP